MSDIEALWWLPIAAVGAMTALALLAATGRPPGTARQGWTLGIVIAGIAAVALTAWLQVASRAVLGRAAARLAEIDSRLDRLGQSLPQAPGGDGGGSDGANPGDNPAATFDTVSNALQALNARIEDLQEQLRAARETYRNRRIEPETAAQLTAALRGAGPYRVVVSTVPGNAEAFAYANQFVNVLREAGWDAHGPETTTMFGAPAYPGVTLSAPGGGSAAKAIGALIEAFARFNIPYRSGIPPREAIPDPATVSLFVSGKS
jgi:hypothetical protein